MSVLFGFTGLRISEGDWHRYSATLPEGWKRIEIERIWIHGKPMHLIAENGKPAQLLEENYGLFHTSQAITTGTNSFEIRSARSKQRMPSQGGRKPDRESRFSLRVGDDEGNAVAGLGNVPCTIWDVARLAGVSIAHAYALPVAPTVCLPRQEQGLGCCFTVAISAQRAGCGIGAKERWLPENA